MASLENSISNIGPEGKYYRTLIHLLYYVPGAFQDFVAIKGISFIRFIKKLRLCKALISSNSFILSTYDNHDKESTEYVNFDHHKKQHLLNSLEHGYL